MKLVKSLGMALGLLAAVPASATYIITGGANYSGGASATFTLEVPDAYAWTNTNHFLVPDSIITSAHFVSPYLSQTFGLADPQLTITVTDTDADIATGVTEWFARIAFGNIVHAWDAGIAIFDDDNITVAGHCNPGDGCSYLSVTYRDDGQGNVPEPATLALMGLGLAGLGFSRRQRKHVAQGL